MLTDDRPTSAPRIGQPADRHTSARGTGHDDEIARHGTDVDAAVAVAEGARTDKVLSIRYVASTGERRTTK